MNGRYKGQTAISHKKLFPKNDHYSTWNEGLANAEQFIFLFRQKLVD